VKPLDPRLLHYSAAARGYLAVTVALGLAATGLILLQASLLAHVLAAAATGTGVAVLGGTLALLAAVLVARAAASYGGEVTALRAAAAVKSQLRRLLTDHALRLGPSWLAESKGRRRAGEVTTLATRGLVGVADFDPPAGRLGWPTRPCSSWTSPPRTWTRRTAAR
jgi:ATP-binding cassette, subfamily C, bacterial CydD